MAEWFSMFAAAKQLLSLSEQAEGRVTFFRKASPNELPQLELGCLRASYSRAAPSLTTTRDVINGSCAGCGRVRGNYPGEGGSRRNEVRYPLFTGASRRSVTLRIRNGAVLSNQVSYSSFDP